MIVKLKETHKLLEDDKRIDLRKNKKYIVYGITIWETGIVLALKTVSNFECPYLLPDYLFDIVDASVPHDWKMAQTPDAYGKPALRISFPEMTDEPEFYSRLYDGEKREKEIFENYRKKYEEQYADLLNRKSGA